MTTSRGLVAAFAVVALAAVFASSTAVSALPPRAEGRVYANGELWATFGLKDYKHAPDVSVDLIFTFPGTSLISVAEASPGDPDYNGGRWDVREVTFTGMAPEQFTSDDDVWLHYGLGHLTISGTVKYFECPLLKL